VVPNERKDLGAAVHVEIADLAGGFSGAESESDDAAGRGAADEIEMLDHGSAAATSFQVGKDGSRENPADAAAIDREDAKVPVRREAVRNGARGDGAGGSGKDGSGVGHSDLRGMVGCSPPPAQWPSISQPSKEKSHSDAQGMMVSAIDWSGSHWSVLGS